MSPPAEPGVYLDEIIGVFSLELGGGTSGYLFKHLGEIGMLFITEFKGDFLDAQAGKLDQTLGLENASLFNCL